MRIYIIRHGETNLNDKGVMQGRIDEPLNENGRTLAVLSGQSMKGIHFDRCFSSPLCRARETAEIVLRESGNSLPVEIDNRITEIDFGELEGKSLTEMGEPGMLFYTDPFSFPGFPGGECIQDVCRRTQDFLKELIAKDDGKTYLVSTHGCAMRGMVNFLRDNPADYWIGHAPYNCSVTIVDSEQGRAKITAVDKVYYDESLIVDHYKQIR